MIANWSSPDRRSFQWSGQFGETSSDFTNPATSEIATVVGPPSVNSFTVAEQNNPEIANIGGLISIGIAYLSSGEGGLGRPYRMVLIPHDDIAAAFTTDSVRITTDGSLISTDMG